GTGVCTAVFQTAEMNLVLNPSRQSLEVQMFVPPFSERREMNLVLNPSRQRLEVRGLHCHFPNGRNELSS
ncbi:MAG: hypothetical protein AAGI38_06985, partial [Bacteroidota bacterium]